QKPSRFLKPNAFNRWTLQVEPGKARLLINGHLFHEEKDPVALNPWLALFTKRERRSAWRNPTLKGSPTIPSEAALSESDRLDGWIASYYNETMLARKLGDANAHDAKSQALRAAGYVPPREIADSNQARPEDFDWSSADGIIQGRRSETSAG